MNSGLYRSGTVDGRMVKDILLDTGITRTLVYQKLILREKTSGEVIIHCAHGDEVSYSLAQVEIAVGGQVLAVEAGVSRTLPVSVLLGTNVPQLVNLLSGVKGGVEAREGMPDEALAVNTQAQTRRNVEETILREQRQLDSGVQPRSAGDELEHRDGSGEDLEEPAAPPSWRQCPVQVESIVSI